MSRRNNCFDGKDPSSSGVDRIVEVSCVEVNLLISEKVKRTSPRLNVFLMHGATLSGSEMSVNTDLACTPFGKRTHTRAHLWAIFCWSTEHQDLGSVPVATPFQTGWPNHYSDIVRGHQSEAMDGRGATINNLAFGLPPAPKETLEVFGIAIPTTERNPVAVRTEPVDPYRAAYTHEIRSI